MADHTPPFRSRVLAELRAHHRERKNHEDALAKINSTIREIEETAPSVAAEYAKDPGGMKGLGDALEGIVKICVGET